MTFAVERAEDKLNYLSICTHSHTLVCVCVNKNTLTRQSAVVKP